MAETRFHALLKAKIMEEIDNHQSNLGSGGAADYAAYKETVGYLLGLRAALRFCEDVEAGFE